MLFFAPLIPDSRAAIPSSGWINNFKRASPLRVSFKAL
jgi:hypothetical protein